MTGEAEMRGRRIGPAIGALATALILGLAGCDDSGEAEQQGGGEQAAPRVVVAGVATRELTDTERHVGTVAAVDRIELTARVEGFLAERLVEDGALVERGQPLMRIQRDQYEAALAQAKADVAQTEANLALADIELERDARLLASDTIAQSRYDATKATRDATAALLEARRAQVRLAELNLGYTEIAAPFEGRIGNIAVSEGDVVGPGSGPLATLVRLSPMEVGFSIAEGQYVALMRGFAGGDGTVWETITPEDSPDVALILPDGSRFDETGRIVFIDNEVDPATGTVALRARFPNADALLAPGVYVTAEILSRRPETRLLVPQAAVQRDQKGDFVLVVGADGLVKQRHVELGREVETFFVVADGLQAGESVIVEGIQRVRPGVPVEAVRSGAAQ